MAQRYTLQIVRGDEKTLAIHWKNRKSETPIDLTGKNVVWQIGATSCTPNDFLQIDAAAGLITLNLPPAITNTILGNSHVLRVDNRTILRGSVVCR